MATRIPQTLRGLFAFVSLMALCGVAACDGGREAAGQAAVAATSGLPNEPATPEQVLRGRLLVIQRECGGCHGGFDNPAAEGWLAGDPEDEFDIVGYKVWPRNLTPDDETGLGRFSERQIFNALRYGLRPATTPDVAITSHVPGEGNFPAEPDFLSPGMPWIYWRYMTDRELWDIAAYLKGGLKPVRHRIQDPEAPPDKWAGLYAEAMIGTHELPSFPTAREAQPAPEKREQVLRGRRVAAVSGCSGCHGGAIRPDQDGWLTGLLAAVPRPDLEFDIDGHTTRPRNLTPHQTMGLGRFSERQIFNALRYGLRPGETADAPITSHTAGTGNFPRSPKFLAPPMPWPAWRHLSDQELWDLAAYLKYGLKPVENRVADSEGPPDFWVSRFRARIGPYPAAPFPTANERAPGAP